MPFQESGHGGGENSRVMHEGGLRHDIEAHLTDSHDAVVAVNHRCRRRRRGGQESPTPDYVVSRFGALRRDTTGPVASPNWPAWRSGRINSRVAHPLHVHPQRHSRSAWAARATKGAAMSVIEQAKHAMWQGDSREGELTKNIEEYTAGIPSSTYLAVALVAMGLSLMAQLTGRGKWGNFIAQWVPTWLLFGLYNKIVKTQGHDRM
jgi:hypothetical protein